MEGLSFGKKKEYLNLFYNQCWRSVSDVFQGLATCAGQVDFKRREIGTRWKTNRDKEYMSRSRVYTDAKDLIEDIAKSNAIATSIELGSVFPLCGQFKKQRSQNAEGQFEAWHYIVIDIDLNSSFPRQNICTCKGKQVCDICWDIWITSARKVLTWLFSDVFGFECTFDCFSGRRGIHFWILDLRVQRWTNQQRQAFAAKLVSFGDPEQIKDPHTVDTLFGFLEPTFDKYFWDNPNFPYVKMRLGLDKYDEQQLKIKECFKMLYPDIDTPVITQKDHLIKLPLSPHGSTGLVAIPLPHVFKAKRQFKLSSDCILYNKVTPEIMQQLAFPIRKALDALSQQGPL